MAERGVEGETQKDIHADRQTLDRQTGRQIGRQTDRQTDMTVSANEIFIY